MPTELHVILPRPTLPTTAQWQAALDSLSLPVALDPAFAPASPAGSCRATLRGHPPALFEFHTAAASTLYRPYPGLKGMFPTRDLAATFRFGPDATESDCALACLAALAHLTQSPYFDPREGACHAPDFALTRARAALAG